MKHGLAHAAGFSGDEKDLACGVRDWGFSVESPSLPDHVFELELAGAVGGFLGARAFERGDFFGDVDGGLPAAGLFEKGERAERRSVRNTPTRRAAWWFRAPSGRLRRPGSRAFSSGSFSSGSCSRVMPRRYCRRLKSDGLVLGVGEQLVINGQRFDQRGRDWCCPARRAPRLTASRRAVAADPFPAAI